MKGIDIFKSLYTYNNCKYNHMLKCTMNVGGIVLAMCEPQTTQEIIACKNAANKAGLPLFVCGNLSNTIIKDGGYNGVIMHLGENFSGININKNIVTAKSGTSLVRLAKQVTNEKLGGLEFAGGIPGTVGGSIRMNAGAYDGQMSDVVSKVKYICENEIVETNNLEFGYRTSIFSKRDDLIIIEAEFELKPAEGDIHKLTDYNAQRKEKQPIEKPNCGSVFKRPKGHFVGKLIDDCNLKGYKIGGAMVSKKHSGFIVNDGGATAKDVLSLMEKVKDIVKEKTGVNLESEWIIMGED